MGIKTFKPTSPARRYYSVSDFAEITKAKPERTLLEKQTSTGGRNNNGRITSRFRGGGHKQRYRVLDFRREKVGVPAKVAGIEYDPNRTARIALLHYADGEKRYILAPDGLKTGAMVIASRNADIKPGNSITLRFIPPGTTIHNVEIKKGRGGQLVRSAGVSAQLMAKDGDYAQVRLPSGEIRKAEAQSGAWDYLYEPDAKALLDGVMLRFVEALVFQMVNENMASEQSSRMVAMKAASDNAADIIDELKLIYNKSRQAAITKELAEIVGGAAAV